MNEKTSKFIQENALQLMVQAVGVIVLILNLWLASKLAPLAKNLELLTVRVSASEGKIESYQVDHTDIQVIKEQVIRIRTDIADIKDDIKYLRNK